MASRGTAGQLAAALGGGSGERQPLDPEEGAEGYGTTPGDDEANSSRGRRFSAGKFKKAAQTTIDAQRAMDGLVAHHVESAQPKVVRDFCNSWVIDGRQLEGYPYTTLLCARILKFMLMTFIILSVCLLVAGFVEGALETAEVLEQLPAGHPAPCPVICPSPWKQDGAAKGFDDFEVKAVRLGEVPGGAEKWRELEYRVRHLGPSGGGDKRLAGCVQVLLDQTLKPHGEPGAYTAWDTVSLQFKASMADGKGDGNVHLGFVPPEAPDAMPQHWSTAPLGLRTTGDLGLQMIALGGSEVSEGEERETLTFNPTGSSSRLGKDEASAGLTELEFFYGQFYIRIQEAHASLWSLFALVTFVLLLSAACNNFSLFELCFPERPEDGEPAPLEPHPFCSLILGRCFVCCQHHEEEEKEGKDVESSARDGTATASTPSATARS